MKFTFPTGLIGWIICFLIPGQYVLAQQQRTNFTPLNFIENKGQWNQDVIYKTELDGAAIFLKKTGFTFLMMNQQDLWNLNEYVHGHSHRGDTTVFVQKSAFKPGTPNPGGPGGSQPPPRPGKIPDVRGHAYNVTFLNANPNVEIVPEKEQEAKNNYFIGNDRTKWASNVGSYQGINYNSLYNGIDAHVYSEGSQLKYDLIVHPGANPDNIQLLYEGATGMELKKGQLYVHTSVGDVIEQLPFAYQYINNQRVTVKVSYKLNGSKLGFKISGDYNTAYPLIIDPIYVFSTVSGSRSDNWGFTATYDAAGNLYGGGIVFGGSYPITPGAVQSVYGGGQFDIAISKFNPNGTRLVYATFIGGNGLEQPHSLFVDQQGNLVISGRTTSSDYPSTAVKGTRGGWDIAITKINALGSGIIGSLIIAGTGDDGVNMRADRAGGDWVLLRNYGDDARSEVVVDDAGYIYVASCTRSTDFPVTPGVFQSTNKGSQDAVIMKINPLCQDLVWASYLGGAKEDAAYVIALNGLNTLYVAGGTASDDFPVTAGALYPQYRGGVCDGFVVHISNDGKSILQGTYLGSDDGKADQVYGIQLDKNGFVYVMGTTEGAWPIKLISNNSYNENGLQFISKLQPDLKAFIYSTTFGKNRNSVSSPNISPTAFLVDRCENVYVSGWGGGINTSLHYPNSGTTGMTTSTDALQRSTDGMDFYFYVLQRDAVRFSPTQGPLYGSYFGGSGLYEHVDGGTSRFDRNGIIYQGICAWCNVSNSGFKPRYPTTPGAYSSTPPASCNFGALKIAFNLDGVKAGVKTKDRRTNYCAPERIYFEDTTHLQAQTYKWFFDDETPEITVDGPTGDTISHYFTDVRSYRVRLIKIDPKSCNGADTAYVTVKLGNNKADLQFEAKRQEPCEALLYQFTNESTPAASFNDSSFIMDFGDGTAPFYTGIKNFLHNYKTAGIYNATLTLVDTNFCNAPQTITYTLRVAKNVVAAFTDPGVVCAGTEIQMENTSLGGETFKWTFSDDNSVSNDPYPIHKFNIPGPVTVTLEVDDPNTCNKRDVISKVINVAPLPVAAFTFTPSKAIENTPLQFDGTISTNATHYLWNFGDGDTTSISARPTHQYLRTGTYNVCLTVTNSDGCTDTKCQEVSAIVVPLFDVPNAFAPNGKNNTFYVQAFGATKFNLKIFNRWGQLVFESSDPRIGWDGRFKGEVQPMDAYAYIVNLEFTDGTKGSRSGSVTLLR